MTNATHAALAAANAVPLDRPGARLVRAWLLCAVVDGLFAAALGYVYGVGPARIFRGVASVLLGPSALDGGTRTALIGVAMHVGVALGWSTVFVLIAMASPGVRRALATRSGMLATAAIYGPCVWLAMSLVVIPALTHRAPTLNYRWWVQLVGHAVTVGWPIVGSVARGVRRA